MEHNHLPNESLPGLHKPRSHVYHILLLRPYTLADLAHAKIPPNIKFYVQRQFSKNYSSSAESGKPVLSLSSADQTWFELSSDCSEKEKEQMLKATSFIKKCLRYSDK